MHAMLLVLALSVSAVLHDALVVVGVGAALLAGVVFVSLGLLLPGLLTWTDGRHGPRTNRYLEPGPEAAPLISAPAPRSQAPTPVPVAPLPAPRDGADARRARSFRSRQETDLSVATAVAARTLHQSDPLRLGLRARAGCIAGRVGRSR